MHDCYDTDARRQLAAEHVGRLAEYMRSSRPLAADESDSAHLAAIRALLRRAAHLGRSTEPERPIPSYTPK
jgi:hypothetical protein